MNEQLKQAIESWILQDQRRVDKQSHLGLCLLVLQQISILRHADPEIMKQAGWVRDEEWISVEDRLPEFNQSVLLFDNWESTTDGEMRQDIRVGYLSEVTTYKTSTGIKNSCEWRGCEFAFTITHWKPLPQPPKQ